MIYGLTTTIAVICFLFILIIVYLKKPKFPSARTTTYKWFLIFSTIHCLAQIAAMLFLKQLGKGLMFNVTYIIHLTTALITWYFYYLYVLAEVYKMKTDKLKEILTYNTEIKIFSTMFVIFTILMSFAPMIPLLKINELSSDYIVMYTLPTMILTTIASYSLFMLPIYKLIKYRKNTTKKFILANAMCISIICTSLLLQTLFIEIAILQYGFILTVYIFYFSSENPDIIIMQEIKSTEKQSEINDVPKIKFLDNLTEDVKIPLNKMLDIANNMRLMNVYDTNVVKNNIESLKSYGNQLLDQISSILDVSHMKAHESSIQERNYSVKEMVKNIINYTTDKLGDKPVKTIIRISPSVSSELYGDYSKIHQILTSILNYACINTYIGKITVSITSTKNNNTEFLTFKISDTGCGIKDKDKVKVFDEKNEETYGVLVAKRFTELLGGIIWFESLYEAGTTFFLQIPQKIADITPVGDIKDILEAKSLDNVDFSKYKVLIVDNNILNIKLTKRLLENYKFTIESVTSGNECVYKIKSGEHFDIIFIDIMMPEMDGVETLEVLKQIEEAKGIIKVALTANAVIGMREEYLSKGFDEYISKPIQIKDFEAVINKYFNK